MFADRFGWAKNQVLLMSINDVVLYLRQLLRFQNYVKENKVDNEGISSGQLKKLAKETGQKRVK